VTRATTATCSAPPGSPEIAGYAAAIGPDKDLLADDDGTPTRCWPTRTRPGWRACVHVPQGEPVPAAGLRRGTDPAGHGDLVGELERFLRLGLDAAFTDFPDAAVFARAELLTPE